jgi:signal transduction histidine kinase
VKAWVKEPRVKHKPALLNADGAASRDRLGLLYVSVKDTGVGMPKSEQAKLFNDF